MSDEAPGEWLVLFDIDGTLLKCGPQIRRIFQSALEDVFGTAGPVSTYDFAGRTDHGIVIDLMSAAGIDAATIQGRMIDFEALYVERLEERLIGDRMTLLPGVRELLTSLLARQDAVLGLLTGNFERGARIKLGRLDLNRFFAFGAFGDDAVIRSELPPRALSAARQTYRVEIDPRRTLVIGDSVLDVQCARDHGMRSIAVATGFTSADALHAAGADCVVEDLTEAGSCHEVFALSSAADL